MKSQKGQATLETILLVVVAVVVILGVVYRFNTAFKKYTTDLYGTYYRCLLETGELPGAGSVCKDKSARFEIAQGREKMKFVPGAGGVGNDGSGGSGGGSGGSGGKGSDGKNGKGGSKGSDDGGSGGGSSSGGDSVAGSGSNGSGQTAVGRLQLGSRKSSKTVGKAADLSKDELAAAGERPDGLRVDPTSARREANDLRAAKARTDFKIDGDDYQRASSVAVAPSSAVDKKNKDDRAGNSLRPRKAVETPPTKKADKGLKDDSSGLSFGNIFRIFLMGGIIVAILVFLGGQVLQISKSSER